MAHLLGAEGLRVVVGSRTLLDGVSLGVDDGMRVGVVGRNGAGKSTLLRLLAGRAQPDDGRVTRAGGTRVAVLDQADDLPAGSSVRDVVHGDVADHVWASQARVREVHDGLLADVDPGADVATLSGGQRRRTALAAVLTDEAEVLVLDEPTNHLDVEGVDWLARHVAARFAGGRGALLVVTHDRWFLDAVCTQTWEVHDAQVDLYEGGYAAYVLARAERARTAAVTEQRRSNLLRKELAWLRRGAPARTSKPKFRLDAAAALIADEPPPRDQLELTRLATARLGKDVLDLEDVTVRYPGADAPVLDGVTWRLAPGERVGVVGPNGAGKSTLLRLLEGGLEPTSGRVKRGRTVVVATLSQETRELDEVADSRVLEAVEEVRAHVEVGGKELTAGQLVERLGFSRERARTPVRDLSGGERRRLQLLRLLVGEPNVLLLDEPTNDLDTDTLAAVEDLLDGWPGTLVVVSHDRYLLERVTDHQVALLGDGAIRDLPGGVEEYLALRRSAAASPGPGSASSRSGPAVALAAGVGAAGSGRASGGPGGVATAAESRAARKGLARLERQVGRLEERIAELNAALLAAATDHQRATALGDELAAVLAERDDLEEQWLTAAELAE